ncbi:MAG: L-seryl-tRNA(Sec) selenium transferase [Candidatus Eremiobacteraeota bacterium]|nr:L-seryl-tRNA(Sec) selenium transferase [Candidatus Eremiobacteraeota bacterium]MBV8499973.1 L-seryl-tRNA(Sec) selenium transferase [Candidatus Eremiobacteraeota bacterium]
MKNRRWELPAVHRILDETAVGAFEARVGRAGVKRVVDAVLDRVRSSGTEASFEAIVASVLTRLHELAVETPSPLVNATGIILHTNLGRAPLAPDAIAEVERIACGYSNLEYDLERGERGSRHSGIAAALCEATGAQDGLVVNNCAAAVLLVLDTFAKGREVIVARNALVEIGGGFRIPEVLERSGARLVEVGTTNRVYLEDFERALSPRTALLLRTHPSNYRIEGFTHDVSGRELAELGRRAGVPVAEDLGSGALLDLAEYGAEHERTVREALADGIGLVTFSGDKLLGGPQAGIVVGRANLLARMRNNPLLRALRVDKLTLAALAATLRLYRDGSAAERIPLYRMLAASLDELRHRAQAYASAVPSARVVESDAYVGAGALPQSRIASVAVSVGTPVPDELAKALRSGTPPIVARIDEGRVVLDLRTIAPAEDELVIAALSAL